MRNYNQSKYEDTRFYAQRSFLSPDSIITGKSVVVESGRLKPGGNDCDQESPWPYSLTDYLRGFLGRTISVKHLLPNGCYCQTTGRLIVSGSDFLGLQPYMSCDLALIALSSVKFVRIINYRAGYL
jgi:hypothetical protein